MLDENKNKKLDIQEFKRLLAYLERGVAVQDELEHVWRTVSALESYLSAEAARNEKIEDDLSAAIARDADVACERLINHYKLTGAFLAGLLGDGRLG